MGLSKLPLSYCTNVHPGQSLAEVEEGLDAFTVPVHERFGEDLAAGLWLSAAVVDELLTSPGQLERFSERLAKRQLVCHTLNAFPFGDFHGDRVKEQVYLPDWADPMRLEYTDRCAEVLTGLLPAGCQGSISTVPLGFKQLPQSADFLDRAIAQLLELAQRLERREERTGRKVRLAIEPEPLCLLETTPETVSFFESLFQVAGDRGLLETAREYLGVCYDVCHQAVEFEDVGDSIRSLAAAGVRINKVHITCAVELVDPASNLEGRELLAGYAEPRYLHQVMARSSDGTLLQATDLGEALVRQPPETWLAAPSWRVHFHIPVDAEDLGPLGTTRAELVLALATVAEDLTYEPHLEVETYTWDVLPGSERPDLVTGLTRELSATRELLQGLRASGDTE